jgi:hypothetical protein
MLTRGDLRNWLYYQWCNKYNTCIVSVLPIHSFQILCIVSDNRYIRNTWNTTVYSLQYIMYCFLLGTEYTAVFKYSVLYLITDTSEIHLFQYNQWNKKYMYALYLLHYWYYTTCSSLIQWAGRCWMPLSAQLVMWASHRIMLWAWPRWLLTRSRRQRPLVGITSCKETGRLGLEKKSSPPLPQTYNLHPCCCWACLMIGVDQASTRGHDYRSTRSVFALGTLTAAWSTIPLSLLQKFGISVEDNGFLYIFFAFWNIGSPFLAWKEAQKTCF